MEHFYSNRFALARYDSAGEIDRNFGQQGQVLTNFVNYYDECAFSVAIDSQNRIVAGGRVTRGGRSLFAVARYDDAGDRDNTFSGDGRTTTDFHLAENEGIQAVAIGQDDSIIAAGWALRDGYWQFPRHIPSKPYFAVARYSGGNGSLDLNFNRRLTDFGPASEGGGNAVALDRFNGQERIIIGGYMKIGGRSRFALARYNADGRSDQTFSGDGMVVTSFGSSSIVNAIAVDNNHRKIAGGESEAGVLVLARFRENGSLDPGFEGTGRVGRNLPGVTWENIQSMQIDGSGKIVVAGYGRIGTDALPSPAPFGLVVARFNDDGTIDPSFGQNGSGFSSIAIDENKARSAIFYSVVLDQNNRIVAGGFARTPTHGYSRFALIRLTNQGFPDPTFGNDGDGVVLHNLTGTSGERITSLAIDHNGRIVAAGGAILS